MTIFLEPPLVDYAQADGPLCICGHYLPEHMTGTTWVCAGQVGDETCTCLGFRESRKDRR